MNSTLDSTSGQSTLFLSMVYQVWWLALPIPFMLLKNYIVILIIIFHLLEPPSSSLNNYQKVIIKKFPRPYGNYFGSLCWESSMLISEENAHIHLCEQWNKIKALVSSSWEVCVYNIHLVVQITSCKDFTVLEIIYFTTPEKRANAHNFYSWKYCPVNFKIGKINDLRLFLMAE